MPNVGPLLVQFYQIYSGWIFDYKCH